jgi:hypothetical protein
LQRQREIEIETDIHARLRRTGNQAYRYETASGDENVSHHPSSWFGSSDPGSPVFLA